MTNNYTNSWNIQEGTQTDTNTGNKEHGSVNNQMNEQTQGQANSMSPINNELQQKEK